MACNHSGAAFDVGSEGDNPPAVVASKGMGNNKIAQSNINGVFPFNKLPVELQNKIIKHATVAHCREFKFPCLTNRIYKPNVTVGLLLVNHRIYHEAHYQLRKQNTFVFGNFGSDLKTIASSLGPFKCRSGACGYGQLYSTLTKVIFDLGDEDLPATAEDKVHAFGCALRYLNCQITVNSLYMRFAYYTFSSSAQLSDFASGLSNIKVQEGLIITGDEKILDIGIGDFSRELGMSMMPMYMEFQAYNPEIKFSPGAFLFQYVSDTLVDKTMDLQHQYLAFDQKALLKARMTFEEVRAPINAEPTG